MFDWLRREQQVNTSWAIGALVAYIAMMIVNGLAGATTVLGGVDTATVSGSYPNLFAPSGVTFSIWGVIYLLLGIFMFRMFEIWKPRKSAISNTKLNQIIQLFAVSSLLNMIWLFAWQYKVLWLSVLLMIGLLVTLIMINRLTAHENFDMKEYALVRLPFSIYFGWITIATVANITTWLVSIQWNGAGLSDSTWMVIILIVAAIIGIVTALRNHDPAYLAVFIWAYGGILLKHLSNTGFNGRYQEVIITLAIAIAVVIVTTIQLTREQKVLMNKKR